MEVDAVMTHSRRAEGMRRWRNLVSYILIGSLLTGCTTVDFGDKKLTYVGKKDLEDYRDRQLEIDHPEVYEPTPENVAFSQKPRLLGDRTKDEIWDMTIAEAIHLSLRNNKVIRVRGDFLTNAQVFNNPDGVNSIYDPAIRESGVLFGGRGVESALSAFDTTFTTNLLFNHNRQIVNNAFTSGGLPGGSSLFQDTATFTTGLSKSFAYGANLQLNHNVNYLNTDQPANLFPSSYNGNILLQYTQPLWAGAGAEFTRIAGPLNTNISGLSGVNQGVVIARINTDITLVDFEIAVRNMLRDVEDTYWDLYLAYRSYDSEVIARNSALRTWREVHARFVEGARGGGAADEAQARETYFDARSRAETTLQNLYSLELQLRRLLGLPANDGRIIRPADEPVTAEFVPEWHICLAEALTRREELRRQKWNIKSLDLQLTAAQNLANPQFNFVSSYQINGFGRRLIADEGDPGAPNAEIQSMYDNLWRADNTGWGAGFQFNLPLGLRNARSQVRNQELRLAKSREVLALQELEVSHELANSFQTLAWRYKTAQTNFNRRRAAERQLQAFEAEYRAGTRTLDLLLQAQTRLAAAEIAYYTSIVNYNKALTDMHLRKGTLLENNNVHLSEGMWSPEAYRDALRRAWARTFTTDKAGIDPLHEEPAAFASPANNTPVEFYGDEAAGAFQKYGEGLPAGSLPDTPVGPFDGSGEPIPGESVPGPAAGGFPFAPPPPGPPLNPPGGDAE